jgi:uncharacterized RDD family membrane protein YckC
MSEASGTQYGGFWIRFLALLVDSAILFVVSVALFAGATMALGAEALMPVAFAVWLIWFFYFPVMHASARQGTFGKALLGLKVARVDGGRISILRSLARELAKILSSAVFMVGYIMAGFTGRKQALHDLVASTYVVREGGSHLVPALAVAIAGFALPVVLVPMLIGGALVSMMTDMAMAAVMSQPAPTQQAARPPAPPKAAPKPEAPAPTQTAQAPAPTQTAVTPAPTQTAQAAAPAQSAPAAATAASAAPAPTPASVPKPAPVVTAAAAPPTPKPAPVQATPEPKAAEPAKPKAVPVRVAQAMNPPAAKPQAVPAFEPKAATGPKFNDLMTAVLYRDADGVSELLRLGKWADKPDGRGATPLMTAVELGDLRTAEALLRGGANPNLAIPVAEERRDGDMMSLLKRYGSR